MSLRGHHQQQVNQTIINGSEGEKQDHQSSSSGGDDAKPSLHSTKPTRLAFDILNDALRTDEEGTEGSQTAEQKVGPRNIKLNITSLSGGSSQSWFSGSDSASSSSIDSYSKRLLQIKSPRYGADFKITEEGIKIKGMSVLEHRTFYQSQQKQNSSNDQHVSSSSHNNFPLNFKITSVDDFHKYPMKELGNGSFGVVFRVAISNPQTNEKLYFAEKRVTDTSQKQLDLIFKEVKTIFECDSPYLIKLHECYYKECTYYSKILDFMSLGSLQKLYTRYKNYLDTVEKKPYSIPEAVISVIISKTLKGLLYLHVKKHILHRDLKPANILLDDKGYVKISDFGLVGIKEQEMGMSNSKKDSSHEHSLTIWQTFTGSVTYMSPERLNNEAYSYNSDIWSIGIITVELFLGEYPLPNANIFTLGSMTREEICEQCLSKLQANHASLELCSFVETCLLKYKDLGERPDINGTILKHPFIKTHESFSLRSWIKSEYIAKCYTKRESSTTPSRKN
ncbi:hypothetical protein C9374_013962 [Naegleria lovaniensis]|uniref:mitogen-activated protein kinase kinase n=1 Tax=Naegleria lovaniensis TaxID=51637 RepID=A0AA88GYG3_NAELO|nr:uncharacterized protein C9374_013962 [Naegleria lovaniensis]KAG2389402.1 hypothetical protein C9374_013962 [Naegleria lovaniensis]